MEKDLAGLQQKTGLINVSSVLMGKSYNNRHALRVSVMRFRWKLGVESRASDFISIGFRIWFRGLDLELRCRGGFRNVYFYPSWCPAVSYRAVRGGAGLDSAITGFQ